MSLSDADAVWVKLRLMTQSLSGLRLALHRFARVENMFMRKELEELERLGKILATEPCIYIFIAPESV